MKSYLSLSSNVSTIYLDHCLVWERCLGLCVRTLRLGILFDHDVCTSASRLKLQEQ
jgi:hypothetical protein